MFFRDPQASSTCPLLASVPPESCLDLVPGIEGVLCVLFNSIVNLELAR